MTAARLGRHSIPGDNSPRYCGLARKRITAKHGPFLEPRVIRVEEP